MYIVNGRERSSRCAELYGMLRFLHQESFTLFFLHYLLDAFVNVIYQIILTSILKVSVTFKIICTLQNDDAKWGSPNNF